RRGSWGTALAVHLSRLGHDVRLWAPDPALVRDMRTPRSNAVYLPDLTLPGGLAVASEVDPWVPQAPLGVSAVPSHGCRAGARAASPHIMRHATLVSATKGLEAGTFLRMSEVISQELGTSRPVVVLSGPSFALEVAQQLPTAVLAASSSSDATELVQEEF